MYKKMKRLCSVLCSALCLSGSADANVVNAGSNVVKTNVASIDKKLFSKKMKRFVNSEIEKLKCDKQRIGLDSQGIRLNGRLSLLTFDGDFGKKLDEALKTLDLNPLKKYSVNNVRGRLGFYCSLPTVIFGLLTIVTSSIAACRFDLSDKEIDILNGIKHDENVKIIANHFNLEIVAEDEMEFADKIDEKQLEEDAKYTIDPYKDTKIRKEFAVKMFKVLLKAQLENLFGMLPKGVEDAFSKFKKSKMFRNPDGGWDIYKMSKWYWWDVCAASVFGSVISALVGLVGYLTFEESIGKSEEIDIIIGKMEELLKSSDLRLPKTNDSSSPSNTKKNSNSIISSKISDSKLNFNNKKVSNKNKRLNVRNKLKSGSVKTL